MGHLEIGNPDILIEPFEIHQYHVDPRGIVRSRDGVAAKDVPNNTAAKSSEEEEKVDQYSAEDTSETLIAGNLKATLDISGGIAEAKVTETFDNQAGDKFKEVIEETFYDKILIAEKEEIETEVRVESVKKKRGLRSMHFIQDK